MNTTKIPLLAPMLFLIAAASACASLSIVSPPALENRTLRISADIAGFEYQYDVCVKRDWFGGCYQKEVRKETYDLNDKLIRGKLIAMGFVAHVREKQ